MRVLSLGVGCFLACALPSLACDLPENRPSHLSFEPAAGFDTEKFAKRVRRELGDGFMGYAVSLRDVGGDLIAQINDGYARTPCEPGGEQRFNGKTQSPIGSVSKAFTAALAIHQAELLPGLSLEDPFVSYLPEKWRAQVHPTLARVTLREMLQHRAGFAHSGKTLFGHDYGYLDRLRLGEESYLVRAANLAKGERDCVPAPTYVIETVPPAVTGAAGTQRIDWSFTRCYANASLALWNYSTASLHPATWARIEDTLNTEIPYEIAVRRTAQVQYRKMAREKIFDPAGVTAGCNRPHQTENYAHVYDDREDKRGRDPTGEEQKCAVGGWLISTQGLTSALHRIVHTREVVDDNHSAMFLKSSARLVFSNAETMSDGVAVRHGGSRWGGKAKAVIFAMPNGMVAAGIVNSAKTGDGVGVEAAIRAAYEAALP